MSQQVEPAPRLRPVEGFPVELDGEPRFVLHDPAGLAEGDIVLTPPAYFIATLMDGTRQPQDIQVQFFKQTGQMLPPAQLAELISQLVETRYLEGPKFEEHYQQLSSAYRAGTERRSNDLAGAGLEQDETLSDLFVRMFPGTIEPDPEAPRIVGLITPHLDYRRGWECYARVYGRLRGASGIGRFVILGTNHFGRSAAVVATDKDFVTPLGTTRVDRGFLTRLAKRCGTDLCACEYDHVREHSIELQVFALQALFGADSFEIVPALCPDPCGPTGTTPITGEGVDLKVFAEHLRDLLAEDPVRSVVIAAADLSHVGRRFGDDHDLDPLFLHEVSTRDQKALIQVREGNPERFRQIVAEDDNPTRICGVGCIFALLTALPHAEPTLLRYDQTVIKEQDTCVTCCAFTLTEPTSGS